MSEITEKKLIELGFTKEIVSPEENGTEKGYHYFVFEIDNKCLLISGASDELIDKGYYVEFFNFNNIRYTDPGLLEILIIIIKLGVIDAKKEKE